MTGPDEAGERSSAAGMSVNPELAAGEGVFDKDRVVALFGSSPPVLLRAVGNFLKRSPGELDHHALRVVAAAAPAIGDPKMVAELIDRLPTTRMFFAARPLDLPLARERFTLALNPYRVTTRTRLVADLVAKTVQSVVFDAPIERVTPEASPIVASHLKKLANGSMTDLATAVNSRFVNRQVVQEVLDTLEQRIGNRHGESRSSRDAMPLMLVADALDGIFKASDEHVGAAEVERAWALVGRCTPNSSLMFGLLRAVSSNMNMSDRMAREVSHAIYENEGPSRRLDLARNLELSVGQSHRAFIIQQMRYEMLGNDKISESLARELVRAGCTTSEEAKGDARLATVRLAHYRGVRGGRRELLPPLSSEDLDRRLMAVPGHMLTAGVIEQMRDPAVLARLVKSGQGLSSRAMAALAVHPLVSDESLLRAATEQPGLPERFSQTRRRSFVDRRRIFASSPKFDDASLAEIVRAERSDEHRQDLLVEVVHNPSAGREIIALIEDIQFGEDEQSSRDQQAALLRQMASCATSSAVQNRLAEIAIERNDREIAFRLLRNGTVGSSVVSALQTVVPEIKSTTTMPKAVAAAEAPKSLARRAYGPDDVATRVIDGTASADAIDAMVRVVEAAQMDPAENFDHWITVSSQERGVISALSRLADADRLTDVHWAALAGAADTHIAVRFATHPNCPSSLTGISIVAEDRLRETAEAISSGRPHPPDVRLSSWESLPDESDVPFERSAWVEAIDGQMVDGVELVVPRTPRALGALADEMGNCLNGYAPYVRRGERTVASARRDNELYAIAWKVGPLSLSVSEVNSRFNRREVPSSFEDEVRDLTHRINAAYASQTLDDRHDKATELTGRNGDDAYVEPIDQQNLQQVDEQQNVRSSADHRSDDRSGQIVEADRPRDVVRRPAQRRVALSLESTTASDASLDADTHAPSLLGSQQDGTVDQTRVGREETDERGIGGAPSRDGQGASTSPDANEATGQTNGLDLA